jgi:hypothetical protein
VLTLSAHRPIIRSSRGCLGRAALRACMRGGSNRHGTAAGAAASARRCEDRRVRDALAPPAEPGRPHTRALGERRRLGRPRIRCVALLAFAWLRFARAFARALRVLNVARGCLLPPHASHLLTSLEKARRRAGPLDGARGALRTHARTPHRDC